ncbi:hypothetical protein [Burkholderia ubonensis]|uniref:hypothetical protein n=1 Tax=Burkholderia ubonensis TaxID=101571 RepID=UPI0015A599BE|nr:hypothetical protein [Burkholderia ubonensis]
MANPHTLAVGDAPCHHCGRTIAVKINRGGFAYYLCGRCGFEGRHHTKRASEDFLAMVDRYEPQDGPPSPQPDPEPQPDPAKPATPPEPTPPAPANPKPAPAKKRAGWTTLLG